ncbi:MAG TPA: nitroreductase/quinone reductase family protein [Galbitalea sp.]
MASMTRGVRSVVASFSRSRFFRQYGPRMMPPLERGWAVVSRGRFPLSGVLVPSLVLHTIGAKSGVERNSPLMYCPEPGGTMLITGSNFARDTHPAWTMNLAAHPDAAVTVKGKRVAVRATRVPEDKLDETWEYIEKQWPGYRGYERSSGRTLRIFRLQPVPTSQAPPSE